MCVGLRINSLDLNTISLNSFSTERGSEIGQQNVS